MEKQIEKKKRETKKRQLKQSEESLEKTDLGRGIFEVVPRQCVQRPEGEGHGQCQSFPGSGT